MKRVLSCVQPTGDLHLGNYFGAVKNWVALQENHSCIYGVVDYHSMTMPYKADVLRENTWKMVFYLLACGIKPENLFIQSLVPEHTELCWMLGCVTSYGQMTRMTQFKDKSDLVGEKDSEAFVSGGLFYYPVLQAADILIYKADYVPIGKDQEQHIELSRNIAQRFNYQFGKEYFKHPEYLYTEVPKVLSLADPNKKMSKSLGEKHYINLFGDEDRVRKQVKSAVTDSGDTPEGEMSPGVNNLFTLLKACGNMEAYHNLMDDYNNKSLQYGTLKSEVADTLVELIRPFRDNLAALNANKRAIKSQIQDSSAEIRKIAQQTSREVKEIMGIMNPKI
jgi:tryptophanyl-tRNA synthetase